MFSWFQRIMPADARSENGSSSSTSSSAATGASSSSSSALAAGQTTGGLTSAEAVIINEQLKKLFHSIQSVQRERERSQTNLTSVGKMHEKMKNDPGKPYYKHKLKQLYKSALTDCETESQALQTCLERIYEIRATVRNRPRKMGLFSKETSIRRGVLMKTLQSAAQTMPLFIPRSRNENPPPLCGSIPAEASHVAKPGDLVAALIKPAPDVPTTGDESNWILAEVVSYNHNSGRYEIDDIDEVVDSKNKRHILSKRRIVPLPLMRVNPETDPDALFEKNCLILALYPQTTCFYRGIIGKVPESANEDYLILFEDNTYPEGYSPALPVPQRYVILCKDDMKNLKKK
jgi:SAGA-associated factor 29